MPCLPGVQWPRLRWHHPGPGAKGSGTVAIRNFDAWRNVRLNMDTIHENFEPDTSLELFGRKFKYPFLRGRWAQ